MSKQIFSRLKLRDAKNLSDNTERALKLANKELSAILNVPYKTRRSLANTLEPFNKIACTIIEARSRASLFAAVHPNPKVRMVAEKSTEKLSAFSSRLYLRRDLYEFIKDVPEKGLDDEAKRFRKKELLDFELTGVNKPAKVRQEVKQLIEKGVKLGQLFDRNIKDDVRFLALSRDDLEGLPEDYRASHKPDKAGLVRISTQYPDYFPFMQYAVNGELRRKLSLLYLNLGWPKNEKVFGELLLVRKRQAKLLGYADWADYITKDKMVGSAKTVRAFLDQVARLANKLSVRDFKILLERKHEDKPNAKTIDAWELSYYENIVKKEKIGLDTQEARNYFPFKLTKDGVLKTTEKLFGIRYHKVSAPTWHQEVETFNVYRGKKLIGRFYLDLHPRDGKYGHAACFDIRPGIRGVQLPEAALVCNFSKTLMSHDELTTFLHEFGHLIHFILAGDQRWMRFNGFGVEWDFVEAPSQMLEAWALDYKTLKTFARHYKSKKPIPESLVKQMRKADKFARGIWIRRQVFLAVLSLRYHQETTPRRADLSKILEEVQKKHAMIKYPRDTHFYASFGHLNGYSAIYYTYLWSLAIAQDILSPFEKKGMYNRAVAKRYMQEILVSGGSKDAGQLIRNFLKRSWNLTAFREWLEK